MTRNNIFFGCAFVPFTVSYFILFRKYILCLARTVERIQQGKSKVPPPFPPVFATLALILFCDFQGGEERALSDRRRAGKTFRFLQPGLFGVWGGDICLSGRPAKKGRRVCLLLSLKTDRTCKSRGCCWANSPKLHFLPPHTNARR